MTRRSTADARAASPTRTSLGAVVALVLVGVVAACSGQSSASGSPSTTPGIGAGTPTVEPFRTPTPTPKPSLGGEDAETALKELLPGGGDGATCASASDTEDRAAQARIRCTYKSLGQTLWLTQYVDTDELAAAYHEQQAGSRTAGKGCEAGRFHGTYSMGGKKHGEVACLKKKSDAWMVWTIEDRYVLGEVMRKGNKAKVLYQWWAKAKPFGVKGTLKLSKTTPPPEEPPEPTPEE